MAQKMANIKIITAHMSNDEMDQMDIWQGEKRYVRGNPSIRVYTGPNSIESALENDMVLNHILNAARLHYAEGGSVGVEPLSYDELEAFRHRGRNGDNGTAILGPRTRALLEILARHSGPSPIDGAPEFFSLSGMFNSFKNGASSLGNTLYNGAQNAWNTVKQPLTHFAAQALPQVAHYAGQALGTGLGALTGNPALAGMGANAGGWLGDQVGGWGGNQLEGLANSMGPGNQQMNQMAQHAGQAAGQLPSMIQGGATGGQAAGHMLNAAGQGMGNSPMGQGMQSAGNSMMIGQNPMSSAQDAFHQAGGMSGVGGALSHAYNQYQGGSSPYQAAKQGMQTYMQQQPQPQQQQQHLAYGGPVNNNYAQGGYVNNYAHGGQVQGYYPSYW